MISLSVSRANIECWLVKCPIRQQNVTSQFFPRSCGNVRRAWTSGTTESRINSQELVCKQVLSIPVKYNIPSLAPATAIGPAMCSAHCKTRVTVDQIRLFPDSAVFINLGAVWCFDPSVARNFPMSKLLSHNYSAYVLIDAMLVYNINLYLYI